MIQIETLTSNTPLFFILTALIGLLVGSFLNVVIYRIPVMLKNEWTIEAKDFLGIDSSDIHKKKFNLLFPASTCPNCGHKIKPWENIPILSYIFLGGKCSNCSSKIGIRYPLVEFITGLIFFITALVFGANTEAVLLLVFFSALIALTGIDFDEKLLPDNIVLPLLWIGLIASLYGVFTDVHSSVFGAVSGYLSLWSVYWLFKLVTGKEGMGYGDFKLFAAFGAWFGWQSLPLIILLSSLVGAVVGITLIIILGRDKNIPIPFGPYLCGAAAIYVFFGDSIINWYMGTL